MGTNHHSIIWRTLSYLSPYKKEFVFAGLLLAGATGIGFLQPLVIQEITDKGMMAQNLQVLGRAVTVLALLVLLNQSVEMAQTRLFVNIHNKAYYNIFHQVFQKLMRLRKTYFEDKNNAEILSCLQMDVSQVASITDRYTVMSVTSVCRLISGLIGLLIISWKLTIVVLIMVPLKILLVRRLSRRQEEAIDQMIESSRDFSQWFGDNLEGVEEIKLWNLFESRDRTFQEKLEGMLKLQKSNTMIDAWNTLGELLLEWSVTIMLYIVGGILICQGKLSIGSVFAFVSYSWYVTGPISALLNLKMYFARIMPSARRLFKFLDMETESDDGNGTVKGRSPRIEFKDVTFAYQENRPILRGASFHVEPGEKVAIIGQNGSGKSTIINLLLRFYTPGSGDITADGVPISQLALDEYRSLFSVVSQKPYLFLGNIAENVDLTGQAAQEKVKTAMQTSGVADYAERMPEGTNTKIGRNGAKLSGGEKQKLAVARALLKDAPIVILDEATSGFDVESDAYLHDVIVNQMADKSVIMITHRYENLEGMDRIYRLKDRKITEKVQN
ncbi:MAG: ABC transporter ATP-binding protein [Acutalibacter sp.]|uniref:ABC transporter ATP-binding protein n=1 Tax=Acutalibacter sp. TaxID=1918636 RepID=UPI0021726CC4|nr:ABC transporter ATP-binding protein [Acutalibacter sp.]MCI9226025.1 ABC transporter ATP-binding protein [Acutalibacter sp.]